MSANAVRPGDRRNPGGASLQIGRDQTPGDEDRRHVTVVFADVANSTPLAERLDPEDFRHVLGSVLRALADCVDTFGGTVDKYTGDALMAVFGAPVAHEKDAERAVRAALAMHEAIAHLNKETIGPRHGTALALRIGADSGEVVAGTLDSAVQSAYTIVGDTVNTAQRLQSVARPGDILVSADTRRQLGETFDLEPIEALRVKGKAEPLAAYRVFDLHGIAGSRRVASPLVGRRSELSRVEDLISRLATGEGAVALIVGEAGIGKSRLLEEAAAGPAASHVRWLEGESVTFGERTAYQPFVRMIRTALGADGERAEAADWDALERRLRVLLPDSAPDVLPYLATLLSLHLPDEFAKRLDDLDGNAIGRQVFRAMRLFVERLARERPLALVFEDAHWMDESSFGLLEHLMPLAAEAQVLFLVTSRPAEKAQRLRDRAPAGPGSRFLEIPLTPLSNADTSKLLGNLLAVRALPPTAAAFIEQRAEGNPFFLEEIVRSLIDGGLLMRADTAEEWRATADIEEAELPGTLRDLVMSRLDRLEPELKRTIRTASVIGRSFPVRLLRLADESPDLEEGLARLESLELIRMRARVAELQYEFSHAVIQETAYESVLLERRRDLHRRVGEAIEQLYPERVDDLLGQLAFHFARAEVWQKAQEYLFRAGDKAGTVAADAEALAHYRDAFAAYAKAFGERWDPVQRASLERRMGEALFRRGEHAAATMSLHRALDHLGSPMPPPTRVPRAILRQTARQLGHRLLPFAIERGAKAADLDAAAERARVYELLSWMDFYLDPRRLLLYALLLLNESERDGYARGIVQGAFGVGFICDLVPLSGIAAWYYRHAARFAQRSGSPLSRGYAYLGTAFHGHRLGTWSVVLDNWRHAAVEFWNAGELRRWAAAMWGSSRLLLSTGHAEESRAQAEEMIRVGRDGGDTQVQGWGALLLGRNLSQHGEFEQAEVHLREAIALLRRVPDHLTIVAAQGDLGCSYLRQGRIAEALAVLEDADRSMREQSLRGFLALTRNALAEAYLAAAESAIGDERAKWLAKAAAALNRARRQIKVEREGAPGYHRVRGTFAWIRGDRRAADREWERSLAAARRLGAAYEEGATAREVARRRE